MLHVVIEISYVVIGKGVGAEFPTRLHVCPSKDTEKNILKYFPFFFQKIGFNISCKL